MLERLVERRWPIGAVLSDEAVTKRSDRYLDLKTDQWEIAVQLIKPCDIATIFFSYEDNPSISCILPILHGILLVSVLQLMIYHLFVNSKR